jgi:hypothetical protein
MIRVHGGSAFFVRQLDTFMKTTSTKSATGGIILLVASALLVTSAVLATSTQPKAVGFSAAAVSAFAAVICFTRRKKA